MRVQLDGTPLRTNRPAKGFWYIFALPAETTINFEAETGSLDAPGFFALGPEFRPATGG
jgi:hypothetical protein